MLSQNDAITDWSERVRAIDGPFEKIDAVIVYGMGVCGRRFLFPTAGITGVRRTVDAAAGNQVAAHLLKYCQLTRREPR